MGFIYLAISPQGKKYVGQTKRTVEIRWKEHITEAFKTNDKNQCRVLNAAIRKHGPENFVIEIVEELSNEDMDLWESLYIDHFESLYPDGYNLTKGGQNGCEYTDIVRDRMSDSQRIHTCEFPLPRYMCYVNETDREGFFIKVPGKKTYKITSNTLSLEDKYERAWEIYEKLINNLDDEIEPPVHGPRRTNEISKTLPKYITYDSKKDGFEVRIPGTKRGRFYSKNMTTEEKKQAAIDYYNSLK
jgi:group I intron endonuclease